MVHLLRNYLVITRKYVLVLLAVCFVLPYSLGSDLPGEIAGTQGTMILLICSIYAGFFCLVYLSGKESQHHSAVALLSVTPYTRAELVVSKYVFALLLSGAAALICGLQSLWMPVLRGITPLAASAVFFVTVLTISVYLPLIYQFGYDKTRLIAFAVIALTPFLVSLLEQNAAAFSALQLPAPQLTAGLWAGGVLLLASSAWLSVRSFSRAELA